MYLPNNLFYSKFLLVLWQCFQEISTNNQPFGWIQEVKLFLDYAFQKIFKIIQCQQRSGYFNKPF